MTNRDKTMTIGASGTAWYHIALFYPSIAELLGVGGEGGSWILILDDYSGYRRVCYSGTDPEIWSGTAPLGASGAVGSYANTECS